MKREYNFSRAVRGKFFRKGAELLIGFEQGQFAIPYFESLPLPAIELLQERRTALISAAVTGKIDVRGLVPS